MPNGRVRSLIRWAARHWLISWFALILAVPAGVVGFVYSGVYNVAATSDHLAPTYWLLHTAMTWSVRQRARAVDPPPLGDEHQLRTGVGLYREHCRQCHGAPGEPPKPFALGLTPVPVNLAETAKEWRPREIYWAVRHGIKMTAMPAWEFRLSDEEIWAVVAFVTRMPDLSPAQYQAMGASSPSTASR